MRAREEIPFELFLVVSEGGQTYHEISEMRTRRIPLGWLHAEAHSVYEVNSGDWVYRVDCTWCCSSWSQIAAT